MSTTAKLPTIQAFRHGRDKRGKHSNLVFHCPHCRAWHIHGSVEGHRVHHCHFNLESPFRETGYYLMDAGEIEPRFLNKNGTLKKLTRNRRSNHR